jgi:hypothetical protein
MLALPDEKITMRKYLLSVLVIIAATMIAAEAAELAIDAMATPPKYYTQGRLYYRRMIQIDGCCAQCDDALRHA